MRASAVTAIVGAIQAPLAQARRSDRSHAIHIFFSFENAACPCQLDWRATYPMPLVFPLRQSPRTCGATPRLMHLSPKNNEWPQAESEFLRLAGGFA
jgi:hypothetical protein